MQVTTPATTAVTAATTQQQPAARYYGSNGQQLTRAAFYAIKCATMRRSIGAYAARQHFLRNSGTRSLRLYRIACQLQAMQCTPQPREWLGN